MIKSSWYALPAAFFLLVGFSLSQVKTLFVSRLVYFLLFLFLFQLLRRFDLYAMLRPAIAGVAAIIFSYGIVQKFVLFPYYLENIRPESNYYAHALITRIRSGRVFSLFSLPTLYAIVCAILLIFLLYFFIRSSRRLLWGILLGMGILNLILTQSFGGLVYLSAGILLLLLLTGILKKKYLPPLVMVLSLLFFVVMGLRFSELKRLEPLVLRVSNWNQAARMIGESPLLGVGLGNYEARVSYHIRPGEARSIYAHNFVLQFLAETGVLLPLVMLPVLIFGRRRWIPPPGEHRSLYAAAATILVVYNAIDIGFYFFSAALAGVVILSQLFPAGKRRRLALNGVSAALCTGLLLIQSLSTGHQQRGHFLLSQNDLSGAQRHYRSSLGLDPFNHRSWVGLAQIQFNRGRLEESEVHLERALALYPDLAYANHLLSQVLYRKGRFLSALYHARLAMRKQNTSRAYGEWYRVIEKGIRGVLSPVGTGES